MRKWIMILLVLAVAMPAAADELVPKSAIPAYILACTTGFGFGHLYLDDPQWTTFFAVDLTLTVLMFTNSILDMIDTASRFGLPAGVMLAGSIIDLLAIPGYALARAIEAVSVFRLVDEYKADGRIAIQPRVELSPTSAGAGIRVSW